MQTLEKIDRRRGSRVQNMEELIDLVGAGCDPNSKGPEVIRLTLWNGRIVTASYYRPPEGQLLKGDIDVKTEMVWNNSRIKRFVKRMLKREQSFTVVTGSHDTVCALIWEIQKPRK